RIGINGFGRIGRQILRIIEEQGKGQLQVVAVNDLTDAPTLAHLFKYDSMHRRFPGTVEEREGSFVVNGREVKVLSEKDPGLLPWKTLGVDIVVESSGVFRKKEQIQKHVDAGAAKVLLTVPAKGEIDATVVVGVNEGSIRKEDRFISNASCTTNCLAPMVKVLNDSFGVEHGLMTTIHSYTNDQRILDMPHKDLRRARAAALNMIPTTTGAATAVAKVIPELKGRLDGMSIRVPTADVSITDFVAVTAKPVTVESVNASMRAAAEGPMKGILDYCEEPLVTTDFIGCSASCVLDSLCTMVVGDRMVKVIGWYDNEWGYSCRCVDLLKLLAKML
ncbi:MAG: type I glyceraldehyde-3-phosphate dehydrogenase, partial [Candidatus Aureabacteria bacterium]|nr:type I glyceraldehyde-3-phosphate dehydrogenase [Candidatus Auribacterota bacterium]